MRRWLGAITAAALSLGGVFVVAPAYAQPGDESASEAQFLVGDLLSAIDLTDVVGLGGATASNEGVPTSSINTAGLDVSALGLQVLSIQPGLDIPLGDIIQLGAVNQFAQADDRGISRAASGAVGSNGAISVSGSGGFPADATIDLSPLLAAAGLDSAVISEVAISLRAISGVAAADASQTATPAITCGNLSAPTHCRDYSIAGGDINITAPAVAGLVGTLTGAGGIADTVDAAVGGLVGPEGALARALAGVNAALSGLIGNDALTIQLTTDIDGALNSILDVPLTDPATGVSIDLRSGVISADLNQLLTSTNGTGLSDLAPGTEILSSGVLNSLVDSATSLLNTLPTLIDTALTETLEAADITIIADVCLVGGGAACTTPVVDVGTGINVTVDGTVAQVIDGSATADITLKVAGLPVTVSVSTLLGALAAPLISALFDENTGVIAAVTGPSSPLQATLSGLISSLSPVLGTLNLLASLRGNVQESPSAGVYREAALRLSLLNSLALTVDLGTAQVGANTVVADVPTILSLTPAVGPESGGTPVTISGSGFTGATGVSFGGTPGSGVTVVSDTVLTVTTPAHIAGPANVVVTTPTGASEPSTFTFAAVPQAASLAPTTGPISGGQTVTIAGSGFTPGATTVQIDGVSVTPTAVTATSVTFVTPAHAAGAVAIRVTTAGGTSAPGLNYTYVAAPVVAALTPASGPVAGGTVVAVTGTGLGTLESADFGGVAGTVLPFGAGDGATQRRIQTPPHPVGAVTVTLTTSGGTADDEFTYRPEITALSPDSGAADASTPVTITGSGFTPGTVVTVGGVAVPTTFVDGGTLQITVPVSGGISPVDIQVSESGVTSNTLPFTYGDSTAPVVSSMSPTAGPSEGGTAVTFIGSRLDLVSEVSFGPLAGAITSRSATEIVVETPAHPAGPVPVTVTAVDGGTTNDNTFTYRDAPQLSALSPSSGPAAGGNDVVITGEGFTNASAVSFGLVSAASFTVDSDQQITAVPDAHAPGSALVTVATTGGVSNGLPYVFVAPTAPGAQIVSLSPASGSDAGGESVVITGTGFLGSSDVTFGGVSATAVTIDSDTRITVTTPAHLPGDVDVIVHHPGGDSAGEPFTFIEGHPQGGVSSLIAIAPTSGPTAGGTTVTVTGSGFVHADGVDFGGTPGTTFTVVSDTEITVVSPAHAEGDVPVAVTGPSGDSDPVSFTYTDGVTAPPAPTVSDMTPVSGAASGGTPVTITGTGLLATSAISFGDDDGTATGSPLADFVVISDTEVRAITPPRAAGAVEVTVQTPGGTAAAGVYTYVSEGDTPTAIVTDIAPDHGSENGGTVVTLTGTGLDGATGVTVDGEDVPFAISDDGAITITMPAHAPGAVPVVVQHPAGNAEAVTFTYDAATGPAPIIDALSPQQGSVLGGDTVIISGENFDDVLGVTIDGADIPFVIDGEGMIAVVTLPHDAGDVDVVVTSQHGSSEAATFTYVGPDAVGGPNDDGDTDSGSQGPEPDGADNGDGGGLAATGASGTGLIALLLLALGMLGGGAVLRRWRTSSSR